MLCWFIQAVVPEYILQKKRGEMMAKDKPGFQIYIVPDVFRFIHCFRHRQTYVNFLGDSEHLKLNVV